jgi:hypothetical protein
MDGMIETTKQAVLDAAKEYGWDSAWLMIREPSCKYFYSQAEGPTNPTAIFDKDYPTLMECHTKEFNKFYIREEFLRTD